MFEKLSRPVPRYVRASIVTSFVAMLFGLDTGSIGPVTTMPSFTQSLGELSPTMHGVVISSSLLTGAITALMGGILADRYGRTPLIAIGAIACGVGMAIECGATHLGVFILGRLVKGAGDGLFLSTVYVQISEMSPSQRRGALTSIPQFMIVIGIVTGFFTCYGTALMKDTSAAWRLPLGLSAVLALGFAALLSMVPPSPRWLLAKGRTAEARTVADSLGLSVEERDDLLSQHNPDLEHAVNQTFGEGLKQMVGEFGTALSAPYRGRTLFGCFIMGFQQFSGIDGMLYYAPILFRQAGLDSTEAVFLASGVSALVILAVTLPATIFADHWSRKTSSLVGGTLIAILMLVMGSLYAADEVHGSYGAGRWVVIVSIYLFTVVFSATWAISFRAYLVESLPGKTRSSASSLAQSSNWLANYMVALTTPVLIARSSFGAYYFFAFATLFCTILCAIFMVETNGQSLEVIEQRYSEGRSSALRGWAVDGFRLRRIQVGGD